MFTNMAKEYGKKGRQKQLEQAGGTVTITEESEVPVKLRAGNGSDSSTGQKPQTLDIPCSEEMATQLQSQLNNTNPELQEAKKERQNKEEVPHQNSEGAGLVKDDEVTRISESVKRGLALHVYRRGELIRGNIARDSKASIDFFIFVRHKSTKIDYLVPVSFRVDFEQMTTSLVLDETRI